MATMTNGGMTFAETRYARPEDVREYGRIDWNRATERPEAGRVPVTLIPMTEDDAGMYGADAIYRSNYRSLVRDFGTYGDDGQLVIVDLGMTRGLGYIGRDDSTPIGEIARQLAHEYPLYDEEDHSELNWADQEEYLVDGGVWDFRHDTGDEFDDVSDAAIVDALREAVMAHDYHGDWDGSGYRAWDDVRDTAAAMLRR